MANPNPPLDQPDPWDPDRATCEAVQELTERLTRRLTDREAGESFTECLACGEVDSHDESCIVLVLEAWLTGDTPLASRSRTVEVPSSPTSEGREEFKCGVDHPSLGVSCDKGRGHTGDHRCYIEQHDAVEFWPRTAPSDLSGFSAGPWTACRMVHEDRGDDLTPDELGEYVKNSVIKSAQASGSTAFLFVSCEKPDGPADVCHVGNGPTSPANARLIAAAPDLLRENTELRASLTEAQAERDAAQAQTADMQQFANEQEQRAIRAEAEIERLRNQAQSISVRLSDAGCPAMTLPEGVGWLVAEIERLKVDAAEALAAWNRENELRRDAEEELTVSQAENERLKAAKVCVWHIDDVGGDSVYETGCKQVFECMTDGLTENGFKFCIYCGGRIEESRTSEESDGAQ